MRDAPEADLRRPADGLDRRNRGGAVRPNTIYVGSGEGLHRPDLSTADGMYKSTDGGRTWSHLGLRDAQQIPALAVDQRDAKRSSGLRPGRYFGARDAQEAAMKLARVREHIAAIAPKVDGPLASELLAFNRRAAALEGVRTDTGGGWGRGGRGGPPAGAGQPPGPGRGGGGVQSDAETLWGVSRAAGSLGALMNALQSADVTPTRNAESAISAAQTAARLA